MQNQHANKCETTVMIIGSPKRVVNRHENKYCDNYQWYNTTAMTPPVMAVDMQIHLQNGKDKEGQESKYSNISLIRKPVNHENSPD